MVDEDSLVWSDSTHGEYSVKSGYKLLMNVTGKINGGSQQDDWSSLWKICAPPKAKHLLWRISKGSQARLSAGLDQFLAPFLLQASSVKELIFAICSGSDKELAGLFAMLVWVLWNNRNNVVWNELQDNGRNLGFKARHMWEEWISVQQLQHGAS
ncbi:uncharacterized protein LOC123884302 [Trifolium pratense]|uniref:uncharacterized protein LOC123884302 n=1 Tax=Trifolium pratense TaxID=57577 RepID=UPI001E6939DC|nr:uncharacterized protein LOC123884302 [Trifolium pratense]